MKTKTPPSTRCKTCHELEKKINNLESVNKQLAYSLANTDDGMRIATKAYLTLSDYVKKYDQLEKELTEARAELSTLKTILYKGGICED